MLTVKRRVEEVSGDRDIRLVEAAQMRHDGPREGVFA
jgi:hypothetical protein